LGKGRDGKVCLVGVRGFYRRVMYSLTVWIYFKNGFKDGVMFFSVLFVELFSFLGYFIDIVLLHGI
jgi:hypothetical protein